MGQKCQNWKLKMHKNTVWFDRTEVSVPLDGILFCALSSGHGNGALKGFANAWTFMIFFVGGPT